MPAADGTGLHDRLRLMIQKPGEDQPIIETEAAPKASAIELRHAGVTARCALVDALPPMHVVR